jgi:enoyl-CoA hydratase
MAVEDDIQFERDGHVARIWLNRPHKRNCITVPMLHRLDEIITEIEADSELRVVVVRGRGNTFSSGFDLDSLQEDFIGTSTAMDVAVLGEGLRPVLQHEQAVGRRARGLRHRGRLRGHDLV